MMSSLSKLAELIGGTLQGGDLQVSALSTPENQHPGSVCILSKPDMAGFLDGCAAAYIVPESFPDAGAKPLIKVKNVRKALVDVLLLLYPAEASTPGVSDRADIAASAKIGAGVRIEAFVSVGEGSEIGGGCEIKSGAVIGKNVRIGSNSVIFPRVTVYDNTVIGANVRIHAGTVIGSDGFGYIPGAEHTKIPHVGNVIIEDYVEIGANTTIDRATIGSTVIGKGTKIDNLVQIAHNDTLGRGCLIASQCGVSGSVTIGDHAVLAGQVGIADHIVVGNGAMLSAQAGIMHDIPDGGLWGGSPAQPQQDWIKQTAIVRQLPELRKRLIALEKAAKKD